MNRDSIFFYINKFINIHLVEEQQASDSCINNYKYLFQLMFNHVTNFIYEAEKLANKYIEDKNNPPYKAEKKK